MVCAVEKYGSMSSSCAWASSRSKVGGRADHVERSCASNWEIIALRSQLGRMGR
jgi:hypothetical protein